MLVEYHVSTLDQIPERGGILAVAGEVEVGIFRVDGQLDPFEVSPREGEVYVRV